MIPFRTSGIEMLEIEDRKDPGGSSAPLHDGTSGFLGIHADFDNRHPRAVP
jgi:hypothetical protein